MRLGKKYKEQLDYKAKRKLHRRFPWPYNGMINDLYRSIVSKSNYLAAMGLICYSEICGRQFFHNSDTKAKNYECLLDFIKYMGGCKAIKRLVNFEGKEIDFSDAIRNGLVHEYFLKTPKGGIAMFSEEPDAIETGFLIKNKQEVYLVVAPYYNLFCSALIKAQKEGRISKKLAKGRTMGRI